MSNFKIRETLESDLDFLWDMLYEAIYIPEGEERPPREVINLPDLSFYLKGWGRSGDFGLIAENLEGQPVGAVWIRLFDDKNKTYGYVDEQTPILSMAAHPNFRGKGAGTLLIAGILQAARQAGFEKLSLSVDPKNPARRLYERHGFKKTGVSGTSWDMVTTL